MNCDFDSETVDFTEWVKICKLKQKYNVKQCSIVLIKIDIRHSVKKMIRKTLYYKK